MDFYSCHQCEIWPCDKMENIESAEVIGRGHEWIFGVESLKQRQ